MKKVESARLARGRGEDEGGPGDLSLHEAAQQYDLSIRTLANRVRNGEIEAHKTRGPWGDQWRVTPRALEAFGYQRREPLSAPIEATADPRLADLESELATARRVAAAERNRADEADRELGEAMREIGRLRAALARLQPSVGSAGHRVVIDLDAQQSPAHKGDLP